MGKKRILLMYISKNSGHHHAASAVQKALHELSDNVETLSVDSFHYTNPVLEKIVSQTYMQIIHKRPEVWGYLYDNPNIVRRTKRLRESIHKYSSHKMKALLGEFRPDAVICTQAFPCGMVADYKKTENAGVTLAGILTDYAPHSYWIYDNVDFYFVPSEETKDKLISNGISPEKIRITGIPIDPKFKRVIDKKAALGALDFSDTEPAILIMGGSKGIGPLPEIVKALDNSREKFQIIVVTGGNKKACRYLTRKAPRFKKRLAVFGYAENIDELMGVSSLIIGKPGGITISEAFAKGLPVIIIKPIPGHEQMNTEHLVKNKVAIKANTPQDIVLFVEELFSNPMVLSNFRERARAFSRPDSALDIARTVLQRIM